MLAAHEQENLWPMTFHRYDCGGSLPGGAPPDRRTLTPLVSLYTILDARLPALSLGSRAALAKLVTTRGLYGDANAFARGIGLRDRHQLTYLLGRDGLRSLRTLASWVRVAVWLVESEFQGTSLCHAALAEAQDPGFRYRLVKRLTGWNGAKSSRED